MLTVHKRSRSCVIEKVQELGPTCIKFPPRTVEIGINKYLFSHTYNPEISKETEMNPKSTGGTKEENSVEQNNFKNINCDHESNSPERNCHQKFCEIHREGGHGWVPVVREGRRRGSVLVRGPRKIDIYHGEDRRRIAHRQCLEGIGALGNNTAE